MSGLVLGIDVCNEYSHVSYYDKSKSLPESIPFIGNVNILENPKKLNDMFDSAASVGEDVEELANLLGYIISAARKHCGCREIDRICITTPQFDITVLDRFKAACIRLGGNMEKIEFISHEESFAYYAFNMHRDLWINGVVLMDYSSDGLTACRMELVNVKGTNVIVESEYTAHNEDEIMRTVKSGGEIGLDVVADRLLQCASEVMEGKATSSVYLTGIGFDTTKLPDEFLKYICNKHRVFAGQNLYVKGACNSAWETYIGRNDVLVACRNRLPSTIDMDIVERGKNKIFRIAQAGANWYSSSREVDFIVDECSSLTLHIQPANGQKPYDEVVDFADFPYRQGKMSRINVLFEFTGDDRCNITVKDKGFGEFIKSSGKVVYKTIEL